MSTIGRQSGVRSIWIAAIFLAISVFVALSRAGEPSAAADVHTEKVVSTPHFYQGDPGGQFPENGRNYCCPTAVSDSLVYLAAHGFPKLLPGENISAGDAQIVLIQKLASPQCMATDPAIGTDSAQACRGIQHFVESAGYACKTIEYKGWRPMPKAMVNYAAGTLATLEWIKKAVADPHGAAWLNVGWYVRGASPDEWKRVGGHWVAVVGYGVDGTGHENPNVLLIDNPAIRTHTASSPQAQTKAPPAAEIAADMLVTEPMKQGRLVGNYKGLPRDVAGMYRLTGAGVHLSKKYDAAFLDGAIVLVVSER